MLDFDERMLLAQSIRHNDFVVAQPTYSPLPNVKKIRPDILMESDSHDSSSIADAHNLLSEWNGKVITTPYYPSIRSSLVKKKIADLANTSFGNDGLKKLPSADDGIEIKIGLLGSITADIAERPSSP